MCELSTAILDSVDMIINASFFLDDDDFIGMAANRLD